jgi:hypothetical protein
VFDGFSYPVNIYTMGMAQLQQIQLLLLAPSDDAITFWSGEGRNKKHPACLTILTMTDKHPVFAPPVSVIHNVLSWNFITSLNTFIFFPSAILLRHYMNNKPHICRPTSFLSLKEDVYSIVILFCNWGYPLLE